MPHRAGYFVLAYSWDHHCQRLLDDLNEKLNHVKKEVSELQSDPAQDIEPLLNYYKKWHYNQNYTDCCSPASRAGNRSSRSWDTGATA